MRSSMMRPTRPFRRNPYDATVAQALQAWLTSKGLLALVGAALPPGAVAAAPVPGASVPTPPAWLPPMTEAQIKTLPTRADDGGGSILVVYSTDPTEDLTAWFHYATGDWSKVGGPADAQPGAYKEKYLSEEQFAAMCASAKAVFYAGKAGFLGSSYIGPAVNLAPLSPPGVTAPAAPSGKWGTVMSKETNWASLPYGQDNSAVLVTFTPDGSKAIWYHYNLNDWSELHIDYGSYASNQKDESEFADFAQKAAVVVKLPGGYDWGYTTTKVPIAVLALPPLAMLLGGAPPPGYAAFATTPVSVPAAPGAAATAGVSADVLAALQALHAYVKGDPEKMGMADAILKRIDKNADDYFSSAYSSDFDGYGGTSLARTAFLKKLTALGLTYSYGSSSSGKAVVKATTLGTEAAKAWMAGYSDPALLGVKAKKPKAPKAAAAAPVAAAVAAAEVTAPVAAGPKSKQIASIADNLGLLGPLVKEAAAKVTSVITDVGPNGIAMMMKDDLGSAVSLLQSSTNSITLGYYNDSILTAEKTVTLAVPDAAGMIAGSIAQAMVYFLVYSHESGGKVNVQPPPPLPDPVVVDGMPLVTGAEITTQGQKDALPSGSLVVGGVVRYYAYSNWDTYFKPVGDPLAAVQAGIVFPAPKQPGWPAVQIAPTLAVYSELPVGTLLRTDFSGGSVYAARVGASGYQKVDSGTGAVNTSSSTRAPAKLVTDAATNKATPYILKLGKGTVEDSHTYKEWIEGKRIDNAEIKAQQASALVEMLAEALGIDPRVAALFTTKALQAMIAQTGIPYMGDTFNPPPPAAAQSPLLKKNPAILGGFRSNPERYRGVVRDVLRNARPTLRDLQDAELLEAAGLPLHDCLPRKRNPADGSFAPGTDQEVGIIKAVSEALKAALGSGAKPSSGTQIGVQIDSKLGSMYGTGDKTGYGVRPETGSNLGAYLRYLVAARAAGLWKNYIDPGERAVTRALGFTSLQANDPSQSVRVNADGLTQIETMKAAGTISGPVTPAQAMAAWLKQQKSGNGWFRADVGQPWQASSDLTPPSSYAGKIPSNHDGLTYGTGSNSSKGSIQHWNTYQRAEGGGSWESKLPYPAWAAEPWANVEGFSADYHDVTFKKYTAAEWGASLYGYGGSGQGVPAKLTSFLMRANTRDPRFVLLPGSKLSSGPMSKMESEAAIIFVSIDEKPLKIEVVSVGQDIASGAHLTTDQITAWIRARPAYPTGPKPVGPAAGIAIHRNPAPATRLTMREVHAFLFPRAKWGPGAVRNWLAQRGMEGLQVAAAGGNWRVEVYGSAGFYPGTIRQRAVGHGVVALVGQPA